MTPLIKDKDGVWRQHDFIPFDSDDVEEDFAYDELKPEQELILDEDGYMVVESVDVDDCETDEVLEENDY